MDVAQFRLDFPEFTDTTAYPTSQITFWANVAERMVRIDVWCDMYTTGVELYVAHEITLAQQNAKAAAVGGVPGIFGGVPTSKAVGQVNVSYDAPTTTEKDAGWWNLTTYGKQFIHLARLFGAGCIQL